MKIGRTRTLQSAKYLQKKKKKQIITISLIVLVVIVILAAIVLTLRLPFLQIKSIEIDGASTLPVETMQRNVLNSLDGNYLYVIPKTNIFFYPKEKINTNLQKTFSKINSIHTELSGLNTVVVKIDERQVSVIACEGFKEDEGDDTCYFTDSAGFVYDKLNGFSDDVYFKYYLNTASTSITVGSNFIDVSLFSKLQKFIKNINDAGIKAKGLLIGDEGSYELYVENKDLSNAVVYFDDRTSLDKTLANLVVFWKNAMEKKLGMSTVPNFEYINLRFGNNVFYLTKTDDGKK